MTCSFMFQPRNAIRAVWVECMSSRAVVGTSSVTGLISDCPFASSDFAETSLSVPSLLSWTRSAWNGPIS